MCFDNQRSNPHIEHLPSVPTGARALQKNKTCVFRGQRDSTMDMVLTLHAADPGTIPSTLYSPLSTELGAHCWVWPKNKDKNVFFKDPPDISILRIKCKLCFMEL